MKIRVVASVALAGALALGLSACNFFSPQNTLMAYDPSDGVGADLGDLDIRNVMLFSEDGERATLVMSVVNTGDSSASLEIQYETASADAVGGRANLTLDVPARSLVTTSTPAGGEQIIFEDIDAAPGSLFSVFFQSGSSQGVELRVPVLDSTLAEYEGLLPSPAPTPTPTLIPEPIPTATPGTEPEAPPGGAEEDAGEGTGEDAPE